MDIKVRISGSDVAGDLRSLHEWLAKDTEFRGRVRLVEGKPAAEVLGTIPEMLTVALGSAGPALASVLVAWIRFRTSDVTCRLKRPDRSVFEISAVRVSKASLREQQEIVRELVTFLADSDATEADRGGD